MPDKIIAARRFQKKLGDGRVVIATAELHHMEGNERPHFSLTGEVWRSQRDLTRNRKSGSEAGLETCGAIHEEIVAAFPELAPLARIHLSTDDGVPLHAAANGWYWYADYDGKGTNLYPHQEPLYSMTPHERAAHYLRIEPAELPEGLDRDAFYAFVDELTARWQNDAAAARAILDDVRAVGVLELDPTEA